MSAASDMALLTSAQASALFSILTHHLTYAEIVSFTSPTAINTYGYPFNKHPSIPATSPLLQRLFTKFAVPLPGLRNVREEFWKEQVARLVEKLAKAELSESYERGTLGARKTVATAMSAVCEGVARGIVGGYANKNPNRKHGEEKEYDRSKGEEVNAAWDEFVDRLIYGDMLDELFARVAVTDKIEDHSSLVQAAHEFILVNLASFAHHILILSPEGPYLLKILQNVHTLIPYALIRQTLKVGNAATMINGMIRVILAKISVASVTNWLGMTNNTDDGMNLLQTIISQVLSFDNRDFKKHIDKIEKIKGGLTKEQINALKDYLARSRDDHEKLREKSQKEEKSVVELIFEQAKLAEKTSETQHSLALEYLARLLEIRDRDELTRILCKHNPDIFTQLVKDAVSAYDPVIRALHNAVDLSAGLWDAQCFLDDLIKLSKPKPSSTGDVADPLLTVGDYVDLLRKHQDSLHRFLHQIAKNGPELSGWFKDWARNALDQFKAPLETENQDQSEPIVQGAGAVTSELQSLTSSLSESDQTAVKSALDAHAAYLDDLQATSDKRMISLINKSSETHSGPGMYLARWQTLLDDTLITPATPSGPVRQGKDKDVRAASKRGPADEDKKVAEQKTKEGLKARDNVPEAPEVDVVVRLLAKPFSQFLAKGIE